MASFSKKDIRNNFMFRVTSWDRSFNQESEEKFFLGYRFIDKILKQSSYRGDYEKLLDKKIEEIDFYCQSVLNKDEINRIPFRSIRNLKTNRDKTITIRTEDGKVYNLMSRHNDCYDYLTVKKSTRLNFMSIDHERSLQNYFQANKSNHVLRAISDIFLIYKTKYELTTINSKKFSDLFISDFKLAFDDKKKKKFEVALLEEVENLFSYTNLVIMQLSHNCSKGKK